MLFVVYSAVDASYEAQQHSRNSSCPLPGWASDQEAFSCSLHTGSSNAAEALCTGMFYQRQLLCCMGCRQAVPLTLALLNVSSPSLNAVDTLSRLSHDTDIRVAQNAVLALGECTLPLLMALEILTSKRAEACVTSLTMLLSALCTM